MDLEKYEKGNLSFSSCSICLDLVFDRGERSIAKLHCGHEFHLDCIGSAFNAKGAMQCPNCRKVEKGRWLYASGRRSSADIDFDAWMAEFYDIGYSELPFGLPWCPFRMASLYEEGEAQMNAYYESMRNNNTTYGDLSSGSASTYVCPYHALHGHTQVVQTTAAPTPVDYVQEYNLFPHHPSTDITGPQNHNWAGQSAPHFGPRSFFGSGSNTGPSLSTQERTASRIYQPSVPHSSLRNAPFVPTQRTSPQDTESMVAQHIDQLYGWGAREGLAPLPWIPLEGEAQWWGPFYPHPPPQSGGGRP